MNNRPPFRWISPSQNPVAAGLAFTMLVLYFSYPVEGSEEYERPELKRMVMTTSSSVAADFNIVVTHTGALTPDPVRGERPAADLYGRLGELAPVTRPKPRHPLIRRRGHRIILRSA